jgi:hypothetical protein
MRVYEIPEGKSSQGRAKILLISRAMIRSKHLFVQFKDQDYIKNHNLIMV